MGKSGTSVYMDRKILSWIDEKIKERVYRNRSHAFEYAVAQLMKNDRHQRLDYWSLTVSDIKHINLQN